MDSYRVKQQLIPVFAADVHQPVARVLTPYNADVWL